MRLKNKEGAVLTADIFTKERIVFFFNIILISLVVYAVFMTNELSNTYDGMWKGYKYKEYDWVVSLGRYIWPLVGYSRRCLSPEPFNTVVTMVFFSLGACLIVSLFDLYNQKIAAYVIAISIVVNTAVSIALSYRNTQSTFGVAFAAAVAAVWILVLQKNIKTEMNNKTEVSFVSIILSAMLITISLGCYQAGIGCTVCLMMAYILRMFVRGDDNREVCTFCLSASAALIIGCILYKAGWMTVTYVTGIPASAYHGADSVTLGGILVNIHNRIKDAFSGWMLWTFGNDLRHNIFQDCIIYKVLVIISGLIVILAVFSTSCKTSILRALISVSIFILFPLGTNIAMLLSPGGGGMQLQMSMPLVMQKPLLFALLLEVLSCNIPFFRIADAIPNKMICIKTVVTVIVMMLVYGDFIMVSVDQHIMLKSRQTAIALMHDLASTEEFREVASAPPEGGFVFLGNPCNNQVYRKDELWEYSNDYAKYGQFWLGGNCNTQSYLGYLRDSGISVPFNNDYDYWHQLEQLDATKEMPSYPTKGYVRKIEDVVVIKVSDW